MKRKEVQVQRTDTNRLENHMDMCNSDFRSLMPFHISVILIEPISSVLGSPYGHGTGAGRIE